MSSSDGCLGRCGVPLFLLFLSALWVPGASRAQLAEADDEAAEEGAWKKKGEEYKAAIKRAISEFHAAAASIKHTEPRRDEGEDIYIFVGGSCALGQKEWAARGFGGDRSHALVGMGERASLGITDYATEQAAKECAKKTSQSGPTEALSLIPEAPSEQQVKGSFPTAEVFVSFGGWDRLPYDIQRTMAICWRRGSRVFSLSWQVQVGGRGERGTWLPIDGRDRALVARGMKEALSAAKKLDELPERAPAGKDPVIFLPGICGSRLECEQEGGLWDGIEAWPLAIKPMAIVVLAVKEDGWTPLFPGVGIAAREPLASAPANFYGPVLQRLVKAGYNPQIFAPGLYYPGGSLSYHNRTSARAVEEYFRRAELEAKRTPKTLFTFPYDWRRSNLDHLSALDALVEDAKKQSRRRKVVLVAHSMGGLIARAYVLSSPARAEKVSKMITVATPYGGSVKPYYALLHGYNFDNALADEREMKYVCQNVPSAYQLLPNSPFLKRADQAGMIPLEGSYTIRYPAVRFSGVFEGRPMIAQSLDPDQRVNPVLLHQANEIRAKYGQHRGTGGVPTYVAIGYGQPTLTFYSVAVDRRSLAVREREVDTRFDEGRFAMGEQTVALEPIFAGGDCTVPIKRAELPGATATYYFRGTHCGLIAQDDVLSLVCDILAGKAPDPKAPLMSATWWGSFPPHAHDNSQPDEDEIVRYTLRSDAYLTLQDEQGRLLGYTPKGMEAREIPGGAFVASCGMEFACLNNASRKLKATVTGLREGKFTLEIETVPRGKPATRVTYSAVPVKKGTVAVLDAVPADLAQRRPALRVQTEGRTTRVEPKVQLLTIEQARQIAWSGPDLTDNPHSFHSEAEVSVLVDRPVVLPPSDDARGLRSRAQELAAAGQIEEAERLARQAIALAPDDPGGHGYNLLGYVLYKGRKFADAEAAFRKALALNTESLLYQENLGGALQDGKKYAEAEAVYRTLAQRKPGVARYAFKLGQALSSQRKDAEAEDAYRKATAADARNPVYHNHLGNALYAQKKHPEAGQEYQEAIRLDPSYGAAHANLAGNLWEQGRKEEARQAAQKALGLGFRNHSIYGKMGIDTAGPEHPPAQATAVGRDRDRLSALALAAYTYLQKHGDNRFYPQSLSDLLAKGVVTDRSALVSPLDPAPPKTLQGLACSYESAFDRHPTRVFRDVDTAPDRICVWDRVPFLQDRRNVAFFDGHVEQVDEARFQELLRDLDETARALPERPRGEETRHDSQTQRVSDDAYIAALRAFAAAQGWPQKVFKVPNPGSQEPGAPIRAVLYVNDTGQENAFGGSVALVVVCSSEAAAQQYWKEKGPRAAGVQKLTLPIQGAHTAVGDGARRVFVVIGEAFVSIQAPLGGYQQAMQWATDVATRIVKAR